MKQLFICCMVLLALSACSNSDVKERYSSISSNDPHSSDGFVSQDQSIMTDHHINEYPIDIEEARDILWDKIKTTTEEYEGTALYYGNNDIVFLDDESFYRFSQRETGNEFTSHLIATYYVNCNNGTCYIVSGIFGNDELVEL